MPEIELKKSTPRASSRAKCLRGFALALLVAIGCGKAPTAAPKPTSSTREVRSAGVPSARPAAPLADGCWAGIPLNHLDTEGLIARLGKQCAPGMNPVSLPTTHLKLSASTPGQISLQVPEPSKCYRVAAASSVADLQLEIRNSSGEIVARDSLAGRMALANAAGPVCFAAAGRYQLVVRAPSVTEVRVAAWRAP